MSSLRLSRTLLRSGPKAPVLGTKPYRNRAHLLPRMPAYRLARPTAIDKWSVPRLMPDGVRKLHTSLPSHKKVPFLLADVGEGITECEIIKWHVEPGDTVEEFDMVCEVQSDKASVEITSRFSGRVASLDYAEGAIAKVGTPLCQIEMTDDAAEEAAAVESNAPSPPPQTGATAPEPAAQLPEVPASESQVEQVTVQHGKVFATPAVRRLSREHGVDLSLVRGSGKDGRVMKEDVLHYLERSSSLSAGTTASPQKEMRVPISGLRRAMFKGMTKSLSIPHFGFSEEVDVTELERVRQQLSSSIPPRWKEAGVDKMTMLPLLIKGLSLAMAEHDLFRSTLQEEEGGGFLLQRASHDVSIAVATPGGLLTPALPSVEAASVYGLAERIMHLTERARAGKLGPADMNLTGTVTLSNIGSMGGGLGLFPVLPPTGQLAIGAVGRARWLPRYRDQLPGRSAAGREGGEDELVRRLVLPVSFTADHRVVTGAELAAFVLRWKQLLEQPALWFGLV